MFVVAWCLKKIKTGRQLNEKNLSQAVQQFGLSGSIVQVRVACAEKDSSW